VGHTYSNILIHVVFSTKDRVPSIRDAFRDRLHEYMAGIAQNEFGTALEINSVDDHIHGLISLQTDTSISDAMQRWKSLSSGWIHKTFPSEKDFAWQTGYSAFSVSQSNADRVMRYIENQPAHHKRQTFQEELIALLEKHGIKYDPRYIWD
jgi:putative transposase